MDLVDGLRPFVEEQLGGRFPVQISDLNGRQQKKARPNTSQNRSFSVEKDAFASKTSAFGPNNGRRCPRKLEDSFGAVLGGNAGYLRKTCERVEHAASVARSACSSGVVRLNYTFRLRLHM